MRKVEKIVEIKEDVRIGDIILEAGDKIQIQEALRGLPPKYVIYAEVDESEFEWIANNVDKGYWFIDTTISQDSGEFSLTVSSDEAAEKVLMGLSNLFKDESRIITWSNYGDSRRQPAASFRVEKRKPTTNNIVFINEQQFDMTDSEDDNTGWTTLTMYTISSDDMVDVDDNRAISDLENNISRIKIKEKEIAVYFGGAGEPWPVDRIGSDREIKLDVDFLYPEF